MDDKTEQQMAYRTEDMLHQIGEFNRTVVGMPIPAVPTRLDPERKSWAISALTEELTEFKEAETLEEEVDALIDLTYFALGRIVEMGIAPGGPFGEVQRANMAKRRGALSKRPGSKGFDAVKPPGWRGPDHADFLSLTADEIAEAIKRRSLNEMGSLPMPVRFTDGRSVHLMSYAGGAHPVGFFGQMELWFCREGSTEPEKKVTYAPIAVTSVHHRKPRLLIMGHARHGKDTVCELLRDDYGYRFTSSSMFCAEQVVLPAARSDRSMPFYADAQACFNDRSNHRKFWFDAITAYNTPDKSRLGREIFAEYDVYCGIRNADEFEALKLAGAFDFAIWVDASKRAPSEGTDSCTVTPNMADFVLDNNGPVEDLPTKLNNFMKGIVS